MTGTDALQILGFFFVVATTPRIAASVMNPGTIAELGGVSSGTMFFWATNVTLVTWPFFVG